MKQQRLTIPIDVNEVEFFDLGNKPVKFSDIKEYIGNSLYAKSGTVPLADAAKSIYNTGKAELALDELVHLSSIIGEDTNLSMLFKEGFFKYLQIKVDTLQLQIKEAKKEKEESELKIAPKEELTKEGVVSDKENY